ncbi:hypothetical protein GGH92_000799 [Coemansia sp. RSA 2673]|nr:hypothetical protein GGH92_000799 [Coemansia sp. RSA 2673]
MSVSVSPAQALPSNILRLILEQAAKGIPLPSGGVQVNDILVKELLSVCCTWRQAALEHMWRALRLTINTKGNTIVVNNLRWDEKFQLPLDAENLVREVNLFVSLSSIASGVALRLFSEYMGKVVRLPLTHRLLILITDCAMDPSCDVESASSNAIKFGQLLNAMTNAQAMTTEVKCAGRSRKLSESEDHVIGVFLNSLYDSTKNSVLRFRSVSFNSASTIDLIPQLSSLVLSCGSPLDTNTRLVHKCANSLLSLEVGVCSSKSLFYDINDNEVIYPNLTSLQVYSVGYCNAGTRPPVPNIVPFPILQSLRVRHQYPFSDDVLFRGNSTTLTCLRFHFHMAIVKIINEHRVFDTKHKSLSKVVVDQIWGNDGFRPAHQPDLMKFMGNVFGGVQVLTLSSTLNAEKMILAGSFGYTFENIQVLDAALNWLYLSDILDLLKLLPALKKLTCVLIGLGSEFEETQYDELPDLLALKGHSSEKTLQAFSIYASSMKVSETADCAMLLALACPSLCQLKFSNSTDTSFGARISEALTSGPFSKYSQQLEWLLRSTRYTALSE